VSDNKNSTFSEPNATTPERDKPPAGIPALPPPASFDELVKTPRNRRYHNVPLPILDKTVMIRSLTDRELTTYQAETVDRERKFKAGKLEDANRRLIALCVVDPTSREPMFTAQRIGLLSDWDAADTAVLFDACTKHVGIDAEDIAELVRIRDSAKNFELARDD